MDANNPKDLMKLEVNMPRNVVGDICDLVAKSFKLAVALKDDAIRFKMLGILGDLITIAVALKDDAIRFKMLGILGDLIKILIWIRFYLYRGEKVDVDTIKNELADLKKEFERIAKCDVSP